MSFEPFINPLTNATPMEIPVAADVNWRNWIAVIWLNIDSDCSPA